MKHRNSPHDPGAMAETLRALRQFQAAWMEPVI